MAPVVSPGNGTASSFRSTNGTTVVVVAAVVEVVGSVVVVEALLDFAVLPVNAAAPPIAAMTAPMMSTERRREPLRAKLISVPTVSDVSPDSISRSGASTGLPHELQNAPEPCCV